MPLTRRKKLTMRLVLDRSSGKVICFAKYCKMLQDDKTEYRSKMIQCNNGVTHAQKTPSCTAWPHAWASGSWPGTSIQSRQAKFSPQRPAHFLFTRTQQTNNIPAPGLEQIYSFYSKKTARKVANAITIQWPQWDWSQTSHHTFAKVGSMSNSRVFWA